jgi:flagellar FliL protein
MSAQATTEATPTSKPSLIAKLKIPGIILGIVAAEWVMAVIIMPSSAPAPPLAPAVAEAHETTTPEAVEEPADHHEEAAPADDHGHGKKEAADAGHKTDPHGGHGDAHAAKPTPRHSDSEEVDLGNFTVSGFQPASNSTLFITFHLYATVRHKYAGEFSERLEENQHRIRDNIIVIIRSAEITDLTDAGLGLIKRRILETTNKTLGKPLLQEVVFSEFSFIEQ